MIFVLFKAILLHLSTKKQLNITSFFTKNQKCQFSPTTQKFSVLNLDSIKKGVSRKTKNILLPMATQNKAYFYITVKPKSSRNTVSYNDNGKIEVKITAPPIDGKANKAVIELLAAVLHVPKSTISIDKGSESKIKKIVLSSVNQEELDEILLKSVKKT